MAETYRCPVCGFPELRRPPYAAIPDEPVRDSLEPPYARYFGEPSYDVCDCCGFEFGNDDDPGTALGITFSQYRREWIADGAGWFSPAQRPSDWSLDRQLMKAGLQS